MRLRSILSIMVVTIVAGMFAGMANCLDIGATGVIKGAGTDLKVKVIEREIVSLPNAPSGPAGAIVGVNCTYNTGDAASSLGHDVEYRFKWGDGTYSSWNTGASASHSWLSAGTYHMNAEARCRMHPTVMNVSSTKDIVIDAETVSAPAVPSGPASGFLGASYNYTTDSATNNLGHTVEYRFDWSDGTYSAWGIGTYISHFWSSAGTYQVRAEARCNTHADIVSGWSSGLPVSIVAEAVSLPNTPSGTVGGRPGQDYTFNTGGASCNAHSYDVEYRFDWGDGTYTNWGGVGTSSNRLHQWASKGTYQVKAQARCNTHVEVESSWSVVLSVGIFDTTDMVLVPAGNFNMGSNNYSNEQPIHSVYLAAYYIDKYEVTFNQYDAFCAATGRTLPSDFGWGRGTRPAISITWDDAKAYCEWAGKRLPTEAEWERACRAGTDTVYSWGDNFLVAGDYAWYTGNSGSKTQPVGGKLPNGYGLYDMHGNAMEWVADWYSGTYYPISPSSNPLGPGGAYSKTERGGYWGSNNGDDMRSAARYESSTANSPWIQGFRCVGNP